MSYLYGDSTTSQLKSNFLEFLRDAIDFCVFVLQADAKMKRGRIQIRDLGEAADDESERLERFINNVSRAVHTGDKGDPESPTSKCGARLSALIIDAHRTSVDGIRKTLGEAIARVEAEEAAGREACVKALGELLAPHDPPNTSTVLTLTLGDGGVYTATLGAKAEPAMTWTLELGIPDGHPWTSVMRVDRLMPGLEIKAPQLAGWITKEVKIRPQKIERFIITKIVDDVRTVSVELRNEQNQDLGFDLVIAPEKGVVKATRLGPDDDAAAGAFAAQEEDLPLYVELATKLHTSLANLERKPNVAATFEGEDVRVLGDYVDLIERLVGMMTPIVREIAVRSLTPNELVLRRALSDNRREEIFVAKKTLLEKVAVLPDDLQEIFDPLGLDAPPMSERAMVAAVKALDEKPVRQELPPSVPPPPMPPPPPPKVAASPPPPPPPVVPRPPPAANVNANANANLNANTNANATPAAGGVGMAGAAVSMFAPLRSSAPPPMATSPVRTLSPPQGAPPQAPHAMPQRPVSPVPAPVVAKRPSDPPQIEITEEELESDSDSLLAASPLPGFASGDRPSDVGLGGSRNEALVTALKKIMTLSKNGRTSEAYEEYEQLFTDDSFARYRPEEQRQALKLMVLAKHPADSEAVKNAHRAALSRLKTLVITSDEPADQELLGVTHLFLGDEKAASAAFQTGLDVERIRNPQSDLIATLMRRVSQL